MEQRTMAPSESSRSALACVALLASVSEQVVMDTAVRLFRWADPQRAVVLDPSQMRRLLRAHRLASHRARRYRHWLSLPELAVVAVAPGGGAGAPGTGWLPGDLWVVYRRDGEHSWVLDPTQGHAGVRDVGQFILHTAIPVVLPHGQGGWRPGWPPRLPAQAQYTPA